MTALYADACNHDHHQLAAKDNAKKLHKVLLDVVEQIWVSKGMPASINKDLTKFFAKSLWKAVQEGYGKKLADLEYDTPDYNMLSHLKRNVYQFSAAKNYQQLKALTQALLNEAGNLRTKKEFFDAAYSINDEHVNTWLNTERDTAIASAQMASKWIDFEANKDTMPFYEFDVVMDGHTSEICRPLHGVVVASDNGMLKIYWPPNHFKCRTTMRQRGRGAKPTPTSEIPHPEIQDMFRVNLAEQRLIFPPKHPYWIGLPEDVKQQGYDLMKEEEKDE